MGDIFLKLTLRTITIVIFHLRLNEAELEYKRRKPRIGAPRQRNAHRAAMKNNCDLMVEKHVSAKK